MRMDAPGRVRRARVRPTVDRPRVGGPHASGRWADGLSAAVALIGLALTSRAGPNYVGCALVPFALPAVLLVASGRFRRRWMGRLRGDWDRVESYAAGGMDVPWRAALAFVVIPAALLDLSNNATVPSDDTSPVIPTAIRWLTREGPSLEDLHRAGRWRHLGPVAQGLPYCLRRTVAGVVSAYPVGMVPLALPVVGLARVVGADFRDLGVHQRLEKLAATAIGSSSLGLFFLIALRLAPPRTALAMSAVLSASSGMLSTVGQALWQHDGVIFWALLVLLVEFRGAGRVSRRGAILQGIACGQLPTCRLTAAAFLAPFGAWVLLRSPRRAVAIGAVAALAFAPWAIYNRALYGNPFGPSAGFLAGSCWTGAVSAPLAGILFSPARGLVVYQPWVLLAALGLVPAVRRAAASIVRVDGPPGWVWFCLAAIALQLAMISAWRCWWGGYCWGSRLLIEVVPLFALLCLRPIAALCTSARGRVLMAALALLGSAVQVPGVYWPGVRWNVICDVDLHPEQLWSWSHPPFLFPAVRPAGGAAGH